MKTNDQLFIDSIDLSDSGPKGLVILTDKKTGKVIFKKHNLVVAQGRQYIFSLFAEKNQKPVSSDNNNYALGSNDVDLTSLNKKKLSFLEFGTGLNDVSAEDTDITHINVNSPLKFKIIPSSVENSNNENIVKSVLVSADNRYYLKFEFNFEGTILDNITDGNKHLISELGLFLDDDDEDSNESPILFSRIRFDTIPITSESSFLLQYYVYF